MGASSSGVARLPVGAHVQADGTHFRVWAPGCGSVDVVLESRSSSLDDEGNGYFSGVVSDVRSGALYRFRLDGGQDTYPDPASRFQPEGPHGPSQIVDPSSYRWSDSGWKGLQIEGQVIYEMHVGTFTREGTWRSALAELPHLAELGITVIEMMPIADFSGAFGWGYDGVNLFAPTHLYGNPDDLRRFVDAAHSIGMAVILDVVYNHVGADGNYLSNFSKQYFSSKYTTDWGDAINFDGPGSGPVREFFVSNAGYWIDEFHMDGLRLDATQNIYDDSERHVLTDITQRVRESAAGRSTIVIAENEPQETRLVRAVRDGGYGMDGLWNDDLHHSAIVALTGRNEAYYTDYNGSPQEFVSAMKYGYLYQGQTYKWQKNRRGTSTKGIAPCAFVTFIQNHDQVANSLRGLRIHEETAPGLLRAMTALILLGPGTPMLFQGQEFAASAPFQYFADVPENLAKLVRQGRQEFVSQWRSIKAAQPFEYMPDPCSRATFERCKLDHNERERHHEAYALHRDLLRLRRQDAGLQWCAGHYDGAVLTSDAFLLRTFNEGGDDRLLVVNLGLDLHLNPAPEPLLAPPDEHSWRVVVSTEDPRYGGRGTAPLDSEENWQIPGRAAVLLCPIPTQEEKKR